MLIQHAVPEHGRQQSIQTGQLVKLTFTKSLAVIKEVGMAFMGLKAGDVIEKVIDDFDCVVPITLHCTVEKVFEDHVLARVDKYEVLWIDTYIFNVIIIRYTVYRIACHISI